MFFPHSTLRLGKFEFCDYAYRPHLSVTKTEGISKRRLFVFVWTENRLKAELFESDGLTTMK